MATEIYQDQELLDISFEIDSLDEWKKLNEELGLSKQLEFTKSAKSPIPYPYINESMKRMIGVLCPCKVSVEEYNKTPIPLEVLKQLSYSKSENHFNRYEIHYDDKSPDPFLIGICNKYYVRIKTSDGIIEIMEGNGLKLFSSIEECEIYCKSKGKEIQSIGEYKWGEDYKTYLIARWGDVVRPINELKEMAKERIIEKYGAEIKNAIADKQTALEKLTENATLYLSGEISESKLEGRSGW